MDGLNLLKRALATGLKVFLRDGRLVVRGVRGGAELAHRLFQCKDELQVLLGDPGKVAREVWARALEEIANAWNEFAAHERSAEREPPWINDDELLAAVGRAIKEVTDAQSLISAFDAIEAYRAAWRKVLPPPVPGLPGVHVCLVKPRRAGSGIFRDLEEIDALVLFDWIEDQETTKEDRTLYRAEILARADNIIAESEGRCPPLNPSVHAMFERYGQRVGALGLEERSITWWMRQNAPELSALWPGAPINASWLDWRRQLGSKHIEVLDKAYAAVSSKKEPFGVSLEQRPRETPQKYCRR